MYFLKYIRAFEKGVVVILMVLMAVVVLSSIANFGWKIYRNVIMRSFLLLDYNQLMEIFSFLLVVFIGIELLESIKTYIAEKTIRVEVILLVSIMAIARKVIVLDLREVHDLTLIGIGVIAITMTAGYYLVRLAHKDELATGLTKLHRGTETKE
jgi:uncharacterized membrane protein (DUF373 family)